jgi:putative N6-adenine-specific DNA methylase
VNVPQVATCARGCERALKFELNELGIERSVIGRGAVLYEAPLGVLARVNVFSRVASKALWVIARFPAAEPSALLEQLAEVRFEDWLLESTPFAIDAHLRNAPWDHSLYASQRVKDVVVDRIQTRRGFRPTVDVKNPAVRFVLHWEKADVTFSVDTSGAPLHQRGYRQDGGVAPIKENLAAAILGYGFADVQRPFLDPFCGSGTLAIEQALRALQRAPGSARRFAFEFWSEVPSELRAALIEARAEAKDLAKDVLPAPIHLSDVDDRAVRLAQQAVARAGLEGLLVPRQADARQAALPGERAVVVANLPYGERLGSDDLQALRALYRDFGERLRQEQGVRVLLYTALERAEQHLALGEPTRRWPLYSGPLPTMLRRWDL